MAGLYLHIPFCKKKCAYCDFVSFAEHGAMEEYLRALPREMELAAAELPTIEFDTVFIGGGTPSILPPFAVDGILSALFRLFSIRGDAEISMESNPGTLTAAKLQEYRSAGVNRLSMGLQTTQETLLKRIGRIHSYKDFLESLEMAREAGFENINADLMYALPSQSLAQFEETLEAVTALGLPHISAYSLILEEGTPLYREHPDLPTEEESYQMHRLAVDFLQSRGYLRYEISNYARPGRECRHNRNYWDNGEYLGLGLNSHSALRLGGQWRRLANSADMKTYLDFLKQGKRPIETNDAIPIKEEMFESVMLGFRKTEGIPKADFEARFGISLALAYPDALKKGMEAGWIEETASHLYLTDRGLDLENEVLMEFMD